MSFVPNLKYKTSLCENWLHNGNCHKGSICHFAHGQKELRSIPDNQKIISQQNSYIKAMTQQVNYPSNYKTIKCKFYDKGKCELGDNCTFVHESAQRRPKPQIQNFGYYLPWANYGSEGFAYQQGFYPPEYLQQDGLNNVQPEKVQKEQNTNAIKTSTKTENSPSKEKKQQTSSEGVSIQKAESPH